MTINLGIRIWFLDFILCIFVKMMVLILILFPGKDVLAKAKTGTGKTVAFLVRYFIHLFFLKATIAC